MFYKPAHCLGVGVNFRNEISDDLIRHIDHFDFIEVNTEKFFHGKSNDTLNQLIQLVPIVLHGLTLSAGTVSSKITPDYLCHLTRVLQRVECEWFSDHIAMTHVNGIEIRSLVPVSFSEENVEAIVSRVKQVMMLSRKPFLLENITYYFPMPNNEMSELSFIQQIAERAGCGILLDLNNLYVNSVNHRYDPYDFINRFPLDRVVEVHLAGCDYLYDMLVDTHASSIKKEVLSLFEYVCKKTSINGVLIERDDRLKHFNDLIDEVNKVRNIFKHYCW